MTKVAEASHENRQNRIRAWSTSPEAREEYESSKSRSKSADAPIHKSRSEHNRGKRRSQSSSSDSSSRSEQCSKRSKREATDSNNSRSIQELIEQLESIKKQMLGFATITGRHSAEIHHLKDRQRCAEARLQVVFDEQGRNDGELARRTLWLGPWMDTSNENNRAQGER